MQRLQSGLEITTIRPVLSQSCGCLTGPLRPATLRVRPASRAVGSALGLCLSALLSIGASAQEANPLPTMDLPAVAGQNAAASHPGRAAAPTVQLAPAPASRPAPVAQPVIATETPQVEVNGLHQLADNFRVIPNATARVTADDNIFISKYKQGDVYYTAAAGLAAGWGEFRDELNSMGLFQQDYDDLQGTDFDHRNYFFGSYTPSVTVFQKHSGQNTFDNSILLGTQWQFGKLTASFHSQFRTFSQPEIDVGDRVRQTLFTADLLTRYEISEKTSLEVNFHNTVHHYPSGGQTDSTDWENRENLDYQIFPKTRVGLGLTLGYLDVQSGSSQIYEQAFGRVSYDTTHKLAFTAEGGVEFRQSESGGQEKTNPIFGVGAIYTPFDGTTFNLNGRRVVRSSIVLTGADVATTSIIASWTQRVFNKTTLTISSSYEHLDYEQVSAQPTGISRTDNAFGAHADFAFHFTKWIGLDLAYDYSQDVSSLSQFGFQDNRATLQMDVLF